MHTGDLASMDDEGFIFIVDRAKDMIITGGENVYSAEVENAVCQHPAVAMCAVIGIADANWGERVHAVVLPKPGHAVTPDEIIAHCRSTGRRLQSAAHCRDPHRTDADQRRGKGVEDGPARRASAVVSRASMWFLAAFVLVLDISPAFAQTNTGEIAGVVKDASGGVLPGVTVTARHAASGTVVERSRRRRTDASSCPPSGSDSGTSPPR